MGALRILTSIVPFALFASVIFLPYGENSEVALLFCTVAVVLLVAGGSLAYSTSIGVLMVFFNINMLALIVRCVWEGGYLFNALAGALMVGYVLLLRLVLRLNRAMVENISMKLDSRHESYVDPLTKLWNRRRLHVFVEMLIPRRAAAGSRSV